jgi:hypothetical protein
MVAFCPATRCCNQFWKLIKAREGNIILCHKKRLPSCQLHYSSPKSIPWLTQVQILNKYNTCKQSGETMAPVLILEFSLGTTSPSFWVDCAVQWKRWAYSATSVKRMHCITTWRAGSQSNKSPRNAHVREVHSWNIRWRVRIHFPVSTPLEAWASHRGHTVRQRSNLLSRIPNNCIILSPSLLQRLNKRGESKTKLVALLHSTPSIGLEELRD